ncbi:HEAT repeat domain-containing protein [Methanocalculus taiwanensis]|nr:HEAT repeat domain-containing protein [Methanocalculus taiwanensis]
MYISGMTINGTLKQQGSDEDMVFNTLFGTNIQSLADRGKFGRITALINSDDPETKLEAITVLVRHGGEAYEHLAVALSELISPLEQTQLVREVYFMLVGNPEELVRFILVSPENIRTIIRKYIISEGKPDLFTLHSLSRRKDPTLRQSAIATADTLGKEGFDIILSGLFDRDPDVASESATILERRNIVPDAPKERAQYLFVRKKWNELVHIGKAGTPILLRSLKEGDQKVRRAVIKAIGKGHNPEMLQVLQKYLSDPDPLIVGEAVAAIGEIGGPDAEQILEMCLNARYPLIRMEASWGLQRMGWKPKNDHQKVLSLLAREDWGGLTAMGRTAIPALINALRETHSAVRSGATETLRNIGPVAIHALRQVASSSDPNLALVARNALAEIDKKNQQLRADSHAKPVDSRRYHDELAASLKARESHSRLSMKKSGRQPAALREEAVKPPKPDESKKRYAEEFAASVRAQEEFRKQVPYKPMPVIEKPTSLPEESKKDLEVNDIILKGLNEALRKMYGDIGPRIPITDEEEIKPLEKRDEEVVLTGSSLKPAPAPEPLPLPEKEEEDEPEEMDNFEKLVASLSDRDTNIRISACYALRLYRERAVPPLIRTLHDPIASVRVAAIESLGEIADPEGKLPLIECIKDSEPDVQIAAVAALGNYTDNEVINTLVSLLGHDHFRVSMAASDALVQIRFLALAPLAKALKQAPMRIRTNAAATLGKMEDQDVVPLLMEYLEDPSEEMRIAVAKALARVGYPAIRPLAEVVVGGSRLQKLTALDTLGRMSEDEATAAIRPALGDPDQGIRIFALQMIRKRESLALWRSAWAEQLGGAVPKPKGIPRLKKDDKELYDQSGGEEDVKTLIQGLRDSNRNVQFAAAMKLTVMGRPAIEELLKAVKTESPEIRALAEEVIGEMRDVAVEPLLDALYDESSVVRAIAARNLGRIGAKKGFDSLQRAFETEQETEVRAIIVEALGYIGTGEVVPTLKRALHDRDEEVRLVAARALGYINDSSAVEALMSALDDTDIRISEAALTALKDPDGTPQEHLVKAMRDAGGFRNKSISSALTSIGWTPETEEEEVCFLISENRWFDIEKMGSCAIRPIVDTLQKGTLEERIEAIKTLSHIGGSDAVHALIGILSDEHIMVRKKAEYALVDLGELAVEPLTALLGEEKGPLDKTVQRILRQIESKRLQGGEMDKIGETDFDIAETGTIESILSGTNIPEPSEEDEARSLTAEEASGDEDASDHLETDSITDPGVDEHPVAGTDDGSKAPLPAEELSGEIDLPEVDQPDGSKTSEVSETALPAIDEESLASFSEEEFSRLVEDFDAIDLSLSPDETITPAHDKKKPLEHDEDESH